MDEQEYHRMYLSEDNHWWFKAKRAYIFQALTAYIDKKGLKILDLGAGTGGASAMLEKWGQVTRLEMSPKAGEYLKKRNLKFLPDDIMSFSYKEKDYDLVCLFDVLYHQKITDDRWVLKKVFSSLKKGGFLCITDCALPFLWSHHDRSMHARQRYSAKLLESKVIEAGFTLKKKTYLYFFVFPLTLVIRLLNKMISINNVSEVPDLINKTLFFICKLEAKLLNYTNFPIGSSVLILAQKP